MWPPSHCDQLGGPVSLLRILALTLATVLLAATGGTAVADHRQDTDRVPGDQPLPGHTISNPPVAPLTVDGKSSRVVQGVRAHAAYVIEVPARWNGELVMWAHG